MATVRKRRWQTKDGLKTAWICDYFAPDKDGKMVRRQKTFSRKKDAEAWLPETQVEISRGTHTPDSTASALREAIDAWIKRGEDHGLESSTMRQRRLHKEHILKLLDGDTKLSRYTPARLELFRDELLREHTPAMARKVVVSLRSILRQARAVNLLSADMSVRVGGRQKRKLKVGEDIPTASEVKDALAVKDDPKGHAMLCLLAFAGLRASEIRGLNWDHLKLDVPSVTIEERADETGAIGAPKSEASRRSVKLNQTTVKALKAWKLAQPNGRALVFGTARDKPDGLPNLRRRVLHPLLIKGEVKLYGFHALRHFAVSSWLKTCNGDFKAVQVRAGHATLALTLDTYGHLLDSNDSDQIAAAEKLVLG